jgi:ferrochelatase
MMSQTISDYDAILIVSFGGPEGPDDVIPFLENVLRGKNVPRERMLEVAEHYQYFGGVSPINQQCRALISALKGQLAEHGPQLPIYWGNRNWHPMLADTVRQMRDDGIKHSLAFMTSAFSSYSGCRQYRENVTQAQAEVGESAPEIDKLRAFFNHPGFINPMQERVRAAIHQVPATRQTTTQLVFTAHSIPLAMASGCAYEAQLQESCRLVAEAFPKLSWRVVYQSRSGPPTQPWLEPDVCEHLRELHEQGEVTDVIISPIGFISDHMEVLFDLDTEARNVCTELGLNMIRAGTVGTHPVFIGMIRKLILDRTSGVDSQCLGRLGPSHDVCPIDCCPSGRPMTRTAAGRRPG